MTGAPAPADAPTLRLRPGSPADAAFGRRLFVGTCDAELAGLAARGLDIDGFVDLQLRAQTAGYAARHPRARCDVVEVDGEPVGRLIVDRGEAEDRIVDVALLPGWQRRGIGQALIAWVVGDAERGGRAVTLHVATGNPARRLYERLGFEPVADDGVHVFMRCRALPAGLAPVRWRVVDAASRNGSLR